MLQCRGHRVCLLLTLYTQACSVSQGILSRGQMHGHWQSACYAEVVLPPVPAAVLLYQSPGLDYPASAPTWSPLHSHINPCAQPAPLRLTYIIAV